MKSTGVWASLALLVLLITLAKAHPSWGYTPSCGCRDSSSNEPSAISSGAEIVTYGEPCFCKESLPYTLQIPKPVPTPVETLNSYGYSVVTPPSHIPGRCLQLPVKIQTPIIEKPCADSLSGKSYGITVQHQAQTSHPRKYSFDCAVQKPVKAQRASYGPSMSISIQQAEETIHPRFAPLPIAIQTPVSKKIPERRFTGLTTKVDRVLIPACEFGGCPDCNDIIPKSSHQPAFSHC